MRAKRSIGLFGSALLLGAALVIVFATGGSAAGVKVCPAKGPSCITSAVFPKYVAVGSQGLAIAKFTNQSNSTTNHTVVSITLPGEASASEISSAPAATCSVETVSCDFGSLPGRSAVKVFVVFNGDSAVDSAKVTGTVTFDESNGNTGSPSNDTVSSDSNGFTIVDTGTDGNLDGRCTDTGSSVSAATDLQSMLATYSATSDALPCTPVDTGIDLVNLVKGSDDKIVFVDLPHLSGNGGLADVVYVLNTLPPGKNVNNFVLFQVVGYPNVIGDPKHNPDNFVQVPDCSNGVPPQGSDSCIAGRSKAGPRGIELDLKVLGQGVDPAYWG